jgi:hypothetical protein
MATVCGFGQELVPRRWSHIPDGVNIGGTAFAYTNGDIYFNPALRLEDVQFDLRTYGFKYIHGFRMLGKSARIDLVQTYQSGTWTGLLAGAPATVNREGWSDTLLSFSINLIGAPPLSGREYVEYRSRTKRETIVGAGLTMQLPTGQNFSDKLINLGSNRYTFRPQLGVMHVRGKWSFEATTTLCLYTDNSEFYGDTRLEQDPSIQMDAHLVYAFRPGLWLSGGGGFLLGESTEVNEVPSHDSKKNYGWGLTLCVPVYRALAIKLTYVGTRTGVDSGADTDTFSGNLSLLW